MPSRAGLGPAPAEKAPLTHNAFLATLEPETRARLTAKSDRAGLIHLASHLGALALTGAGIAAQIPLWPLLILPHGLLLTFLFTLEHECTHKTPFATPWLNEATGRAIAPVIALPFLWFRYFHFAHHKHTHDPDRDPELTGKCKPQSRAAWLAHLSGWEYWRGNLVTLTRHAFGTPDAPYLPNRIQPALRREARVILALYSLAAASLLVSPLALWLWLVPVLIGQPFLRLYLLAEHGLCPHVADMFVNTRTTFTTRLVRWLAWNMPYHAEHHALPNVPFHRLPDMHALARPHLKTTAPGYTAFTRDYLHHLER